MASSRSRLRLFVGVYPPPATAAAMAAVMFDVLGGFAAADCRATPIEAIHLTVQFIGDTPVRELDAVGQSVARAASGLGGFTLAPLRAIRLPAARRPARVVAIETDAPGTLVELKRRLVTRLGHRSRRDAADRFLPHFTIGRFPAPGTRVDIDRAVSLPSFDVREVRLMKSRLTPAGSEHACVEAFPLDA